MEKTTTLDQNYTAPPGAAGKRLDAVAASLFSDYSRSRLQAWIKAGYLRVNGEQRRSKDRLIGGELLELVLPPDVSAASWEETWANGTVEIVAEKIDIAIHHTDNHFYIVNKPANCVMHPAPGNRGGTLMNGLLYLESALRQVPRAGIVHRLDKDTSGLCVVARTLKAHTSLVQQLQSRSMGREYLAIALGDVPESGTIDEPIGRHPRDRKRMAVIASGKPALTYFRVRERFNGCALLQVKLSTGRTHQIRVHLASIGFGLLGDPVYGSQRGLNKAPFNLHEVITQFSRQALHAHKLSLLHPNDARECTFTAPPPDDFATLLDVLRASAS